MRQYWQLAGVLAAAMGIALAGCGDGGNDRGDYIAALSGGAGEGFSEDEARCLAEVLVDTVGVEQLEEADVLDKIQDNPDGSLGDYGITLTEEQSAAAFDGLNECTDLRAMFVDMLASLSGLSADLAACVMDNIDDATFERLIMTSLTQGEAGLDSDQELVTSFQTAGANCAGLANP